MSEDRAYYSIPEAARTCGVSRATMWNWVKSGKINAFVTPGGHHRIRCEEMDRLVKANGFVRETPAAPKSILIVDDDPTVRKIFQHKLERAGYQVATAANGFDAGVLVSLRHPDLVLLDLFMEGVDGFEVCRTIKTNPDMQKTKVLAISGVNDEATQSRILAEGADGFIAKDTDLKTLLERIQALLNLP